MLRVLELISYCASAFLPSATLQPYLVSHLRSLGKQDGSGMERHARFALQRVERAVATNVLRKQGITAMEFEALRVCSMYTLYVKYTCTYIQACMHIHTGLHVHTYRPACTYIHVEAPHIFLITLKLTHTLELCYIQRI